MQKREMPKERIEWQLNPLPPETPVEPLPNQTPLVDLSALGQDQLLELFASSSNDLPPDLLGELPPEETTFPFLGDLDLGAGPAAPPQ